jgi:cytochrome c oxidase subunit 1
MTASAPASAVAPPRFRFTHHEVIGRQYFWLALVAVLAGILLSLVMRWSVVWPATPVPLLGLITPERYLGFLTIHGTLMVFFVLTTAPQSAFGNLVLPAQIGARTMAFPWLNLLSFWMTFVAFLVLVASLFVPQGASISGWTQYPPFSAIPDSGPGQGLGLDLWLASIALFCLGSTLSSINFLVTVLRLRAPGMLLMRMPLTVWAWFVTAMITLLSFSVLLAAVMLLFSDRHWGTSLFVPAGTVISGVLSPHSGGSPLLWQHLFWFFGHPEVYIAILPGMGLTSHLLSTFSRKAVFGYRAMILSLLAIAVLGFLVWGHHMFTSGMSPYATLAFSTLTMVIAIPSALKTVNWLGTLWRSRIRLTTPMLFSLGFVSLFITGGLSGPILAQPQLDTYLHDTYFVVAHFHLIMGMAAIFALFAATYFWFPLLSPGRLMNESLGRAHFWLTFLGAYATFLPMHVLGLAGHPRRFATLVGATDSIHALLPVHRFVTIAAFLLAAAQLIFLFNLFWSWHRGPRAPRDPWQATSLEWAPPSEEMLTVHRGAYDFVSPAAGASDVRPQWLAGD